MSDYLFNLTKKINKHYDLEVIYGFDGSFYDLKKGERIQKNVIFLLNMFASKNDVIIKYKEISMYIWGEVKSNNHVTQIVFLTNLEINSSVWNITNIRGIGYTMEKSPYSN
ncbi:hypothetical protein L4C33_17110 [Vibrio makurazakiensis]|uniref:hypothetical protein n=1 Tax=Vibrio makurazakiensis TaxID=2910250 RepID=UPI003D13B692